MANLKASGWPCTQHAPKPIVWAYHQGMLIVSAAKWMPNSISVSELGRATGFGSSPSNTAPDIVIGPAVSPSREIVLHVGISAKHTNKLMVLSERFAVIVPAGRMVVRMLVPWRLPITPNRSLRLRSVLFCDEDVGSLVGEDVLPSTPRTPRTSRLIVWPYQLPSLVLFPGADWRFWWSTGAPCAVLV